MLLQMACPYVVVGGVATAAYMPERQTLDVDILISADDRMLAEESLQRLDATYQGELSIPGSSWLLTDGTQLDVLEGDAAWVAEAIRHPNVQADGTPVIALKFLVLMKLNASRPQDLADISRMLGRADDQTLHEVRSAILEYAPSEMQDLNSLIRLGRLEFGS